MGLHDEVERRPGAAAAVVPVARDDPVDERRVDVEQLLGPLTAALRLPELIAALDGGLRGYSQISSLQAQQAEAEKGNSSADESKIILPN